MNTLPVGIYLEDEKRFEFDFVKHLLKISFYKEARPAGSIVSPFRVVNSDDHLYLLIHNYCRLGERKIMIESIEKDRFSINLDNHSYKLQKVA